MSILGSRGDKYHGFPWVGCGCPTADLRAQVTIRAMQWLLVASVRRIRVGLGHLGACAWADTQCQCTPTHAPPQKPLHLGSSGMLLPCAQCPLPSDREPCFLKIWKAKWGKSSAFCAQRCSRCIPNSTAN